MIMHQPTLCMKKIFFRDHSRTEKKTERVSVFYTSECDFSIFILKLRIRHAMRFSKWTIHE